MMKIVQPTLLLDRKTCKANITNMIKRASKFDVQLIPHFKTHQSVQVGEWFREAGVKAITVTSVKMAKYFSQNGWRDITIAFPFNVREVEELNELSKNADLKIFINSVETALLIKEQLDNLVNFYIEINTGDGRSGVEATNFSEISRILTAAENSSLKFFGFYTHPGHTYSATSSEDVVKISEDVLAKLRTLKRHFLADFPELKLALGDTPSCSILEDFQDIDSIHPGNFVYYDLVQEQIGANTIEEIAICLAVPVVAVHPERNEIIVHSGWVHQGKDALIDSEGNVHYGLVVNLNKDKWTAPIPGAKVIKLSQEHGVLSIPQEHLREIKVGDVMGILPVHACATAVMMGEIFNFEGERLEMMRK